MERRSTGVIRILGPQARVDCAGGIFRVAYSAQSRIALVPIDSLSFYRLS